MEEWQLRLDAKIRRVEARKQKKIMIAEDSHKGTVITGSNSTT